MYNVNPGIMASITGRSGAISYKLIDIITRLGLTSNLQVCLDVGDINSYPGTGQTWFDVSGNGNDYFLGTTSSVEAIDPAFAGVAGDTSSSTYWDLAAGDYFTETTAQTFQEPFHKDGGQFSIVAMTFYDGSAIRTIWSSGAGNTTDGGITYSVNASGQLRLFHATSNSTRETLLGSTALITPDSWNYLGVSVNEATTTALVRHNNQTETLTFAASTSTEATPVANRTLLGGAGGSGPVAGDRFTCMAIWSTPLTSDNLTSLYNELKLRNSGIP